MSANQDQDPAANRKRGATAAKVSALGKSETPVKPSQKAKNKAKKKTAAKKPSAPSAPQKAAPATPHGAGAPAPLANLEKLVRLDIEAIADNMAQLVDEGRKALAAAIGGANPDETRSELAASVADATKTLGAVAEYWLSKPDRAAVAQADLYSGLSEIWRQTLRRY
ncbi:MAG: class I poly(R)-hydroxyalkanoic acid synthase, partial [Methylocystis sp.]|nr:class I poly(R)-hydroxyalkanoic acid synthase [Methylocystis sp.]